jgi:hypothetical protein
VHIRQSIGFSLKIKCTYFHKFIFSPWTQSNPHLRQTNTLNLKKRPYWILYQEVIEYFAVRSGAVITGTTSVFIWIVWIFHDAHLFLDNPILFTKSVALSLASIALCLFLRHLQDSGYSTRCRTRDLEGGELPTKNCCERKGLGFGCVEKTSLQMQS